MVRQKIARLLFAVLALVSLAQSSQAVHAAQNVTMHGITVSPAIQYIKLTQHQNSTTFMTTVTNNTDMAVLITPSVRDFTASDDGRKLTFTKSIESSSNSHGLSDSIKVSSTEPVVEPGRSIRVPVSIVNTDGLAPGGHYAAVIYGVKAVGNQNMNIISVNEAVSCLIFLNTFSGGTQVLNVAAFPANSFATTMPQNVDVVLANAGNTQTVPRGYVQITGPGGRTVAQGIINIDSGMILPDSKRLFPVALSSHGNNSFFGIYHEKLFFRHDGQQHYNVLDHTFYYVNILVCSILAVTVIVVGTGLFFIGKYLRPKIKRKQKSSEIIHQKPVNRKPHKYMDIK